MNALDVLNEYRAYIKIISRRCGRDRDVEKAEIIIDALEKQIPKKPIDDRYPWSICPVCGGSINCEEVQEYIHNKECSHCVHCGQKIDWSGTE